MSLCSNQSRRFSTGSQVEPMPCRRALLFLKQLGCTAGLALGLLAGALPASAAKDAKPEFGPNVLIFDPSMPAQAIQKQINAIYAIAGA